MVTHYCPDCWKDLGNDDPPVCPECGFKITDFYKENYSQKLINALDHPVIEIRHWAIMVLAQKKERRAIFYLRRIQRDSKDPLLVRAAKKAIVEIEK